MVCLILQPVFVHLSDVTLASPDDDLRCMWSAITKAKSVIAQGHRLENLSWRLWYASTNGFRNLLDTKGHLDSPMSSSIPMRENKKNSSCELVSCSLPCPDLTGSCDRHAFACALSTCSQRSNLPDSSVRTFYENPSDEKILTSLTNVLKRIRDTSLVKRSKMSSSSIPLSPKKNNPSHRQAISLPENFENDPKDCPKHSSDLGKKQSTKYHPRHKSSMSLTGFGNSYAREGHPKKRTCHCPTDIVPQSTKLVGRYAQGYPNVTHKLNDPESPNDVYNEDQEGSDIPLTTYPYDEKQFEKVSKAFAASFSHDSKNSPSEHVRITDCTSSPFPLSYHSFVHTEQQVQRLQGSKETQEKELQRSSLSKKTFSYYQRIDEHDDEASSQTTLNQDDFLFHKLDNISSSSSTLSKSQTSMLSLMFRQNLSLANVPVDTPENESHL
jgi:Fungal protein of unknown function (DUF1752)